MRTLQTRRGDTPLAHTEYALPLDSHLLALVRDRRESLATYLGSNSKDSKVEFQGSIQANPFHYWGLGGRP